MILPNEIIPHSIFSLWCLQCSYHLCILLKGEHRWPEKSKEGIIDLTRKVNKQAEKEEERNKEKGKIEIEKKEERFEELDDNLIPLPVMKKDKFWGWRQYSI